MWDLTVGQMRASRSRLIAAGLAIAIGTGFAAATLSVNAVLEAGSRDAAAAELARADLVVTPKGGRTADQAMTTAVDRVDGVRASALQNLAYTWPVGVGSATGIPLLTTTDAPSLRAFTLASGSAPATDGQIAVPASFASTYDVGIGDSLAFSQGDSQPLRLTVTGTVKDRDSAFASQGDLGLVTPAAMERIIGDGGAASSSRVLVALDRGAAATDVESAIAAAVPGTKVATREAVADRMLAANTGGQMVLGAVLTAFAALALIVAALVIANTFAVLVAQRTRTLAMLRCIGASRRQIRRSVLLEGALLGVLSSVVGVLGGFALAQGALTLMRRLVDSVPLPATVPLTWAAVVLPVVAGTVVTVIACRLPAREASRVAPLAALRPEVTRTGSAAVGRLRRYGSLAMIVAGAVAAAGGLVLSSTSVAVALLLGVVGGALSFAGIAWSAVLWIPPASRALGLLVHRSGPASRLAAANALRNPRRMAATSTALLIGVTLVSTMAVGAATARSSLSRALDEAFPVDALVTLNTNGASSLTSAEIATAHEQAEGATGVRAVADATMLDNVPLSSSGQVSQVLALDTADVPRVLRGGSRLGPIDPDRITVGAKEADRLGLQVGDLVRLGESSRAPIRKVAVIDTDLRMPLTGPVPARAGSSAPVLLVAFAPGVDAADTRTALESAVTTPNWIDAPAADRAQMELFINAALAFVLGLLAVAVVIALIGVTNTLSLSVLERRRESATLRSIGMSARQLRRMLAVEGVFLAAVGTIFGLVLGIAYGWLGAAITLRAFTDPVFRLPWATFGGVVAVTLLAGLGASLVPARRAVRESPVEALGVE